MKECRDVAVQRIDAVPQGADPSHLEIRCDERGLAGAGRAGDPHHGTSRCAVELRK